MEAEDQLALRDPAHVLNQLAIAGPVGHLLVLVAGEGMRPGGGDERVALGGGVAQSRPEAAEILHRLVHRVRDTRRHLDSRLEELGLDASLVLFLVLDLREDLVDAGDELVALATEELELLLDAQAEGPAGAEPVLHDPVPLPRYSGSYARLGESHRSASAGATSLRAA